MPQIINTNIASLNAQRNLNKSQSANQTALQRLSSGLRINSAKDDAAGLAISTRFNSQIRGLNVAVRNAGDGISLAQTAEGALGSMNDNLQRIRELAVQSANATNSDVDRDALQAEVSQLLSEVSRTATETDFNGRKLLDGSFSATFQIGANAGQTLDVSIAELTAEKLGAASAAGLTATGNENALSNGDLIINGVSITASSAGDDTASTANAGASAIAKVAAINKHSEETGVTAQVSDNVVSGAEMTGASTTGTLTLNGVDISLTTTASTNQTRAGVVEAINAVSEQTGVMAVNSDSDNGGIQLIAKDGRNITMSVGAADSLTAASTGLALDATPSTAVTYEGGYTLVADSDVAEIVIDGGNGTGRGDLANAGLVAGTYAKGVASSVSELQAATTTATKVTGGSNENLITDYTDTATVLAGGSFTNVVTAASATSGGAITNFFTIRATTAGGLGDITVPSEGTVNTVISALDEFNGINAFERINFSITDFDSSGAGTMYFGRTSIALPADTAGGGYDTSAARLEYLAETINNTTFSGGLTVTAELSFDKGTLSIQVDNDNTAGTVTLGSSTASTLTVAGLGGAGVTSGFASIASANDSTLMGAVAFVATSSPVEVNIIEATGAVAASGELFTGKTYNGTDYGNEALSNSSSITVNLSIDGVAQTAQTLAVNSTVADLANTIDSNFDDVNAWEEISLSFDNLNLEVGDTLYIGTGADVTLGGANGVGVAVSDGDGDGTITLAELADNINSTDFSAQNIDVSAQLAADGNMELTIRNYSGSQLGMAVDGEGRSLLIDGGNSDNDIIGLVQQQLSGVVAYSSQSGSQVDLTLSDPEASDELFDSSAGTSSYTSVNGLEDGDVLINGVSIGAAVTTADTASAEYASDGTKILSSSKELSAIAVAAAINEVSDETGVSATINATTVVGGDGTNVDTSQFEIGDSAEIYINGYSAGTVTLQDDGTGAIDTDRAKADALDVINSIAGKSGVSAVDNGVSLTMTAEDGRNISIAIDDQSGANASIGALFGLDAAVEGIGESTFGAEPSDTNTGVSAESLTYETTYGTVNLTSAGEFTISAGAEGADELAALGLAEGSYGGAVQGQFLTDIDISTFEGATQALTSIDNALQAIASQRADLGAIQNRMESTVSNLAITSENLAAANSRIQDADFAAETAELSRTQVLQQAGISILAQANQGPQQVLSLLG